MTSEIFCGVVAGVVTLPVVWSLREFYGKVVHPTVEKKLYKGASIEGDWISTINFQDGNYNKLQIKITRNGYQVKARAKCIEGYNPGHEFEFFGEFDPPVLYGPYKDIAPHSTERGAIALILSKNGRCFRGKIIFSDDEQDEILTTELILERSSSTFAW